MISLLRLSVASGDLRRSWPSCVVPFVYGEVVLSPRCTNLYRISVITQFLPQHVGRFELLRYSHDIRNDSVFLSVRSGSLEVLTKVQFG